MRITSILSVMACLLLFHCSGVPRVIDEDGGVDDDADPFVEEDVGPDAEDPPDPPPDPECVPEEEVCDGEDNDCDGEVDEDIPPEPCEESGSRRCVMGRWSECPTTCTGCVPGTVRQCFDAYCTGWGIQTCNESGDFWNSCQEASVPGHCDDGFGWAPSEESTGQCCIDEGYCCQDYWDLDGDGETDDSVGTCYGIDCRP